jgi:hypothetical protein
MHFRARHIRSCYRLIAHLSAKEATANRVGFYHFYIHLICTEIIPILNFSYDYLGA